MFTIRNLKNGPVGFGPYNIAANRSIEVGVLDKHIHRAAANGFVSVTNANSFTTLTGASLNDTAIAADADEDGVLVAMNSTFDEGEADANFATLAASVKKLEALVKGLLLNIEAKNF